MPTKNNHLVISALGKDRPGIVDKLARAIYDLDCNITDSRMTVLGGEFAILLLVEGPWNQLAKLEDQVPDLEQRLDLIDGLERLSAETDDGRFDALAHIVLDHALLAEGSQLEDPAAYVHRMNSLLLELDSTASTG